MKRVLSHLLCCASTFLLLVVGNHTAMATTAVPDGRGGSVTAFVDVSVIPMDRAAVVPGQTVIVRDGRIAAIGPTDTTVVPKDAAVLHGNGYYLMPGLADMHIHLDSYVGARPNFADAPLYLSYGITTVLNLRGLPEHLEW